MRLRSFQYIWHMSFQKVTCCGCEVRKKASIFLNSSPIHLWQPQNFQKNTGGRWGPCSVHLLYPHGGSDKWEVGYTSAYHITNWPWISLQNGFGPSGRYLPKAYFSPPEPKLTSLRMWYLQKETKGLFFWQCGPKGEEIRGMNLLSFCPNSPGPKPHCLHGLGTLAQDGCKWSKKWC